MVSWRYRQDHVLTSATIDIEVGNLIDVDDITVRKQLEWQHAALLDSHGIEHLNIGEIRSDQRIVTRTISRTLYDEGAAGILFRSKYDDLPCAVIFEGRAKLIPAGLPEPLTKDIPSLLQVCRENSLELRNA